MTKMNMLKKAFWMVFLLLLTGITAYSQADKRSYSSLLKAANKGDSPSQAMVAYRLKEGIGVNKDLEEAKRWAQIASESWNGLGFWILAQISHEAGDPVSVYRKYLDSAMSCYYPLAWSFFARLYESGSLEFDIEKDEFTAFELFREAANHGDTEAAAQAASLYLTLKNDPWSAFEYFSKAANNGDADSMFMLACLYFNGMGVARSRDKAISFLNRSAKSGSIFAKPYLDKAKSLGEDFAMPVQECMDVFKQKVFSTPEMTLKQVTFDYPVPNDVQPVEYEDEEEELEDGQNVKAEERDYKTKPEQQPQTALVPTKTSVPKSRPSLSSYHTSFVVKVGTGMVFPKEGDKYMLTPAFGLGVYDIGGSRIGAEAGVFTSVGTALKGVDSSMVLRISNGFYSKVGVEYFTNNWTGEVDSVTHGMCPLAGVTFLFGNHFCLEVGAKYYPEVRIHGSKTVNTSGASYLFPASSVLSSGIAPMVSLGWAF